MGALAAASGLGQTLGSSLSGWLFGAIAQLSFGLLMLPLALMLVFLVLRPGWWSGALQTLRDPGRPAVGGRKDLLPQNKP